MINFSTIMAVGCGGFFGAIARVIIVSYFNKNIQSSLPLGILFANIIGSFIIGVLFALFLHIEVSNNVKSFLTAGFLGALTTFSTFAIESFTLLNTSFLLGLFNILLNVLGSIISAGIGYKLFLYFLK